MKILEYDFRTGDMIDVYNSVEEIEPNSKLRRNVIRRVLRGELNQAYGKGYIDLDTGVDPFREINRKRREVEQKKADNRLKNKYKTTWL